MVTIAILFVAPAGAQAGRCALSAEDKAANAALSFDAFDRKGALPSTWRALVDRGCRNAASEAMQAYLIDGPVTDPAQRAEMAFHLAQSLALAGRTLEAAAAIVNARSEAGAADGYDWNTYVAGTWAFLVRDHARLAAAAGTLAAEPGGGNALNAAALSGLLACYNRSYGEASTAHCRDGSAGDAGPGPARGRAPPP